MLAEQWKGKKARTKRLRYHLTASPVCNKNIRVALAILSEYKQENPAIAREDALQSIQFLLQYVTLKVIQCRWFSSHLKGRMPLSVNIVINSNPDSICHRCRDMASFPLKNAHFTPPLFSLKFKNAPLALHPPNFVRRKPRQRFNYSCKKFFSLASTS